MMNRNTGQDFNWNNKNQVHSGKYAPPDLDELCLIEISLICNSEGPIVGKRTWVWGDGMDGAVRQQAITWTKDD